MSVRMIQDRLADYDCRSRREEELALHEITQEIVLAALGRGDLYRRAGFQGGTCLRVFHGTHRFSEDLDFALEVPDAAFDLLPYLLAISKEAAAYGFDLEIDDRPKAGRAVRMAFLKDDSIGRLLHLTYRPSRGPSRKLRVKLEVDANPPAGATFETKLLDFPFPSAIRVFDLPSLFAGKLHALLCREYQKGRDWYDFVWYTARAVRPNYDLLASALHQHGPWRKKRISIDRGWTRDHLQHRIEATDWERAREDVRRFVEPGELPSLELWGREFFTAQLDKLG